MKLPPDAQCAANIRAWAAHHGWAEHTPSRAARDRCYFPRTDALLADIRILVEKNPPVLLKAPAKNHGKSVEVGYREDVAGVSAQVIIHATEVEIDFDFHNPTRDVVGAIGHLGEVFVNKIRRRKTDPFRVAGLLKKRGIHGVNA